MQNHSLKKLLSYLLATAILTFKPCLGPRVFDYISGLFIRIDITPEYPAEQNYSRLLPQHPNTIFRCRSFRGQHLSCSACNDCILSGQPIWILQSHKINSSLNSLDNFQPEPKWIKFVHIGCVKNIKIKTKKDSFYTALLQLYQGSVNYLHPSPEELSTDIIHLEKLHFTIEREMI